MRQIILGLFFSTILIPSSYGEAPINDPVLGCSIKEDANIRNSSILAYFNGEDRDSTSEETAEKFTGLTNRGDLKPGFNREQLKATYNSRKVELDLGYFHSTLKTLPTREQTRLLRNPDTNVFCKMSQVMRYPQPDNMPSLAKMPVALGPNTYYGFNLDTFYNAPTDGVDTERTPMVVHNGIQYITMSFEDTRSPSSGIEMRCTKELKKPMIIKRNGEENPTIEASHFNDFTFGDLPDAVQAWMKMECYTKSSNGADEDSEI